MQFILEAQKKFACQAIAYLVQSRSEDEGRTAQTSFFYTNLLTYLNRIIAVDRNWFMGLLNVVHQEQGTTFAQFVHAWVSKMDFIASRESLRINQIALYSLLPQFSHEMLVKHFSDVARLTFGQLD